jgi:hypothetical protein
MNSPKKLSDAVSEALAAIKAIEVVASETERRAHDAEARAAKAVKQAEAARRGELEAVSKLAEVHQEVIEARAAHAAEREILLAEREQLALSDRRARDELERLKLRAAKPRKVSL